jgi:hypothetical protein
VRPGGGARTSWPRRVERRSREIARDTAAIKREIARGEHAGVELADLLSDTARSRVAALQAGRVGIDYERFVRKHLHLYAPADDGEIEAGPLTCTRSSAPSRPRRPTASPT